jgi:hypothetical protein
MTDDEEEGDEEGREEEEVVPFTPSEPEVSDPGAERR